MYRTLGRTADTYTLARAGTMILRAFAMVVICAAIGAAAVLLVQPPANSSEAFVRSFPTASAANFPSPVEQVATKVRLTARPSYPQAQCRRLNSSVAALSLHPNRLL